MSEVEPFADQAFVSRLQKLLSMLGSAQPAEAEAARLKVLDHLAQHRLSLTDVALRLGQPPPRATPNFIQGAREIALERQLWIAQQARADLETEVSRLRARITALEIEVRGTGLSRILAIGVLLMTAGLGGMLAWHVLTLHREPARAVAIESIPRPADAPPLHLATGERLGQAAVQDLAIRLQPNDDADVRAFLNMGERLVIERRIQTGGQTWLYVRSQSAAGYVRAGDVLRE